MYIKLSKQATCASNNVCCNTNFPQAPFACCSCRYCFLYFIGRYCCLRPVAGIVGVYSSGSEACFLVTALKSSVFVFVSFLIFFSMFRRKRRRSLRGSRIQPNPLFCSWLLSLGRWTGGLHFYNSEHVFSLFWNCIFQSFLVLVICWHGALSEDFWISNQ